MEGGDERLPSRKRSTQKRGGKFVDGALSRPSSILSFPLFSFLLQGARLKAQSHPPQDCISAIKARNKVTKSYPTAVLLMSLLHLPPMGRIHLQKKELVWFGCLYIFLLPQTMLPSNDQIANQSCSFGQQKMATLFGVVEIYTRNRFQLNESVPLK